MLTDREKDLVFISDRLGPTHPALVDRLRGSLDGHGLAVRTIRGTRDIWCRDDMPVQVGAGGFVRFRYAPDYLRGYEHLITEVERLDPIPEVGRCRGSEVALDGGDVVRWGSRCILTDKVFRENPDVGRAVLHGEPRDRLGVDEVIVNPKEPYDKVGHADGVVRFLDDRLVVVNDYSEVSPWYGRRLRSILRRAGLLLFEKTPYAEAVGGMP